MSLLTRCPACTTLYRVVPDQLRISDGWVKCGQCSEIFDASKHLMGAESFVEPARTSERIATEPAASDISTTIAEHGAVIEVTEGNTYLDHEGGAVAEALLPTTHQPGEPEDALDNIAEPSQLRWEETPEGHTVLPDLATEPNHEAPPLPSFLKQASSRSVGQSPLARISLVLIAMLLCLMLIAQWLYFEKDKLAAQYPGLKPTLASLCNLAACTIDPLQRIESLSVDSVGFTQLGKETYRLSFVVKNSSSLPLSIPAVELTITDAQDQPTYRHVFNNKELGTSAKVLAAGTEWAASVALKVRSETPEKTVGGYRLLIFYP